MYGSEIFECDEDTDLKRVGLELMFLTPEKTANSEGISAVELSKQLEMDLATVKKKLKILQEHEIIRAIGINPKIWKFDEYKFQRMDEDDPVYRLLCSFDNVDFERYFKY
ncbi:hypothetical protein tpqmel_0262 [Candidatus Gastranaerophilus sp. (ex Termes propinquus)]|nr:hypothetical protein tpqmel_0262 [Candidatus Gastranaerophilus sp. (ex Termes propinquus)]